MNIIDMPTDPTHRWEWIKYQIRVRGSSMAELARQLEVNDRAIRNAKNVPYPRVERAIAAALGLNPCDIWPERWNTDGTPHRQRPNRAENNASYKNTGLYALGHGKAAKDCSMVNRAENSVPLPDFEGQYSANSSFNDVNISVLKTLSRTFPTLADPRARDTTRQVYRRKVPAGDVDA